MKILEICRDVLKLKFLYFPLLQVVTLYFNILHLTDTKKKKLQRLKFYYLDVPMKETKMLNVYIA